MNTVEWDAHERYYCDTCRYGHKCAIRRVMHDNPADTQMQPVFRRLGHCSQWQEARQKSRRKRK